MKSKINNLKLLTENKIGDGLKFRLYQAHISIEMLDQKNRKDLYETIAYHAERTDHWYRLANGLGYKYESCAKDDEIKSGNVKKAPTASAEK